MSEKIFDLLVIGGGPGGYVAALEAAALGKRVALVEKGQVGGTCLNRGCIPTKALLRAAHAYRTGMEGAAIGVPSPKGEVDFGAIHRYVEETVEKLRTGVEGLLSRAKVEWVTGEGVLLGSGRVQVGEEVYEAHRVLLAAGSRPAVPPIPGRELPGVYGSDAFLTGGGVDCQNLILIGGGVIGAEFAGVYTALGRQVTILEAMPRLLPTLDRELGQSLSMILKKRGAQVYTGAKVLEIRQAGASLACVFEEKGEAKAVEGDAVLICTGRAPNTAGLISPEAGLALERGFVPVGPGFETALPGVYAVGDLVLGGVQLAHVAEAQAKNAVHAMFGEGPVKSLRAVPSCVFTDPEIACVGLSAEEAKEKGLAVVTKKALTSANGRAVLEGAPRGFAKLVVEEGSGRLLGAQLMCPHAGEMIGGLALAVNASLTLAELRATIWPHPTISEILGEV